ncbi:DNA-binding HxlR family transcriptional regulator [Methylorubrum extorquens]|nr:DNA-binding HxlR family transcriptional regulator [Methylorubrum extorquens]
MRLLGGRWRLLIVSYLLDGPKRFSELRRCIPAISQRMLTLDLRALEDAGFVKRTVFPTVPVTVEYELTTDGARLVPVVEVMRTFGLWLKERDARQEPTIPPSLGRGSKMRSVLPGRSR